MNNDYISYLSAPHEPCQGALVSTGEGPVQTLRCAACGFEIAAFAIHVKRPEDGVALSGTLCGSLRAEVTAAISVLSELNEVASLSHRARLQSARARLNYVLARLSEQQLHQGKASQDADRHE